MAMRVVAILLVIGVSCYVWVQRKQTQKGAEVALSNIQSEDKDPLYANPDVEGVEPDGQPDLNAEIELRMVGPQTRVFLTITEKHGWYVDGVYVEFWYEEPDENGEWHQVGDPIPHLMKGYVDFGSTLTDSTTLLDYEFPEIDDFGTTENWRVRISAYGKFLAPKPD